MTTADAHRSVEARPADTLLALCLIAISGNPLLSGPAVSPILCAVLLGHVLWARRGMLSNRFIRQFMALGAAFCIIFAAHQWNFGLVSLPGALFLLVKLLVGGLVVNHLGRRFVAAFFNAVAWMCVSSLVLYPVLLLIGPDSFPTLFSEAAVGANLKSILILTVHTTPEWWRNSSMMWEPGAFQGIINLALVLMPAALLKLPRNRVKILLMLVALLTTFSTTGYLVLFVVLLVKLSGFSIPASLKAPLLLTVMTIAVVTVTQADFLGEKIMQQLSNSADQEDFSPDRFGALLFDAYYIEKSPIFGNGLIQETRLADHPTLHDEALGHGNGLSNFTATFGIFGLLAYVGAICRSCAAGTPAQRITLALIVSVLAFGEQFLTYPLFLALPFVIAPDWTPVASRHLNSMRRRVEASSPASAPQPNP